MFHFLLSNPRVHTVLFLHHHLKLGNVIIRLLSRGCCVIQFQSVPTLPDSVELLHYQMSPAMKWAVSSPNGGSCLPDIQIPAKGDTRPSSCLTVPVCLEWSRKPSIIKPPYRSARHGGANQEFPLGYVRLKKWWKYARSALSSLRLIGTESAKVTYNLQSVLGWPEGEQRTAESDSSYFIQPLKLSS